MPNSTTYHKGRNHFTYRVAAVIEENGRILLHHSAKDEFWSLPGGKVELGEEAEQALHREMREELGSEVRVERLLWLVENFFEHNGERHHELGMYFLVRLAEDDPHLAQNEFQGVEAHPADHPLPLYFRWFSCQPELLADMDIRPDFLRQGLAQIPDQIQNIKIPPVNP